MHNINNWRKKAPPRACVMLRKNMLYWVQTTTNGEYSMGCVLHGEPVKNFSKKTQISLILAPEQYQTLSFKTPPGLGKRALRDHVDMQLYDFLDNPLDTYFYLYAANHSENECHITVCLASKAEVTAQISQLNPQLPTHISSIQFADGVLTQQARMIDIDTSFFIVLDELMPRVVIVKTGCIAGIHSLPHEDHHDSTLHPLQRNAMLQICQQYQQLVSHAQFVILCADLKLGQLWQQLILDATAVVPQQCQIKLIHDITGRTADLTPHHIWCTLAAERAEKQLTCSDLRLQEKTTFTYQNTHKLLKWASGIATLVAASLVVLCVFKSIEHSTLRQQINTHKADSRLSLSTLEKKYAQKRVIGVLSQKFLKQQGMHAQMLWWLSSQNFPGLWLTQIIIDKQEIRLEGESRNIKFILAYINWLKTAPGVRDVSLKTFANKSYQAGQTNQQSKKKQRRANTIKRLQRSLLTRFDRSYRSRQQQLQKLLNEEAGEDSDALITTKVLSFKIAIVTR